MTIQQFLQENDLEKVLDVHYGENVTFNLPSYMSDYGEKLSPNTSIKDFLLFLLDRTYQVGRWAGAQGVVNALFPDPVEDHPTWDLISEVFLGYPEALQAIERDGETKVVLRSEIYGKHEKTEDWDKKIFPVNTYNFLKSLGLAVKRKKDDDRIWVPIKVATINGKTKVVWTAFHEESATPAKIFAKLMENMADHYLESSSVILKRGLIDWLKQGGLEEIQVPEMPVQGNSE